MIPALPSKYKSTRTQTSDGKWFASKREARRYEDLLLLEKAGEITDLKCQVRFRVEINGKKICTYVADFTYRFKGHLLVEDVKGYRTPVYKLKRKLMLAVYGIKVEEI